MNPRGVLLIGGLAAAAGLLLISAGPARAAVHIPDDRAWVRRVIAFVSGAEGKAGSVNRNLDGAGLSFGILQWNQHAGNLGVLLHAMHQADPATFALIFGPSWGALLEVTGRSSLEPVEGAVLWEDPWVSRFAAAGRHPPFVEAQWSLAEHGDHFQAALDAARVLGVRTERAVALLFDRAVQQRPGAARAMAEQLRASGARPYSQLLQAFADLAASKFRRTTEPPSVQYSAQAPHIVWKAVGREWHAVAGRWDLYQDVVTRCRRILADIRLQDVALTGKP